MLYLEHYLREKGIEKTLLQLIAHQRNRVYLANVDPPFILKVQSVGNEATRFNDYPFEREFEFMAKTLLDFIPSVWDYHRGDSENSSFFCMEYAKGPSLQEFPGDKEKFRKAIEIMTALSYGFPKGDGTSFHRFVKSEIAKARTFDCKIASRALDVLEDLLENIIPGSSNRLINGDSNSNHFIFGRKIYWIDWDSVTYGDPAFDLTWTWKGQASYKGAPIDWQFAKTYYEELSGQQLENFDFYLLFNATLAYTRLLEIERLPNHPLRQLLKIKPAVKKNLEMLLRDKYG